MFMLASISKTVTATALMQVWELGNIDLDADVNEVLPFPVRNPAYPSRPITAHQLLTHTSGIRDNWSELLPLYVQGDSPIALATFLERYLVPGGRYYSAKKNYTGWAAGNDYLYSNVGAALVGYLVEEVTGIDFARWCERRIFQPLGMDNTGWHLRGLDRDKVARPYRRLRDGGWKSYGLYGYPDYPDGALRTTARSLARFLAAYSRGGGPILKSTTVDLMLSDQKVPGPWQGLVWYRTPGPGGRPLVGHGGGDRGVTTEMWFRRSDGAGAVVLANGDAIGGYRDVKDIRDRLIREAAHL
jgi:CubicO group peptidase (beta-lactamase class C family)